jgi:hypothetical protein
VAFCIQPNIARAGLRPGDDIRIPGQRQPRPDAQRFHLERIADAIRDTAVELRAYMNRHEEFAAIGERMLEEWENGCRAD